jgi:HAE1 family hydrophobic/amphiphilic exporter-1
MTAFAFILGVLPLILSSGAGAHARILLGLAVFGGMTAASLIGIFLIPASFYVVESLMIRAKRLSQPAPPSQEVLKDGIYPHMLPSPITTDFSRIQEGH